MYGQRRQVAERRNERGAPIVLECAADRPGRVNGEKTLGERSP